jgi:cell division GTPase FtsZ
VKYDFKKVQEFMSEHGMTLVELAEKVGRVEDIHFSTLSKAFKRGTASQRTAKALSKALRIPLKDMVKTA